MEQPQGTQGQIEQAKPMQPPRPAPPRPAANADERQIAEGAVYPHERGMRSDREGQAPLRHLDLPNPDNGRAVNRENSAFNAMTTWKRFGYAQNKHGGTPNENLNDIIALYEDVCKDLQLPEVEARQFLHNLFKDEVLRFYHTNVSRQARNYDEALKLMMDQVNSQTKRQNVKHELQALSFADFVREANRNRLLALTTLYSYRKSHTAVPEERDILNK